MTIAASIDRDIIRYDATVKPVLTVSGLIGQGYFKIGDFFYTPVENGTNEIQIPNRSAPNVPFEIHDQMVPSGEDLTLSGSIDQTGDDSFISSGEGWGGISTETELTIDDTVIQMSVGDGTKVIGLAFLDTGCTTTHDYLSDQIPHSMIFGLNGLADVYELGVRVSSFPFAIGDIAMMQIKNGIVFYSLRHTNGIIDNMCASLANFVELPLGEALAYSTGAEIASFGVLDTNDGVAIENQLIAGGIMMPTGITQGSGSTIGVLRDFQDWFNDYNIVSTSDSLMLADNNVEFSFANNKKRLRQINPNLARRDKSYRLDVETFFNYHGLEIDFCFVDEAKKDVANVHTYWWARFIAPMSLKTRSSCLNAMSCLITETSNTNALPVP